jgi:hypothetical protein
MRNCCGPFKRGKPAKAINPSQQCFADCCGNLCPPDGCCETVKVEYQCGCGCDCTHEGYNFSGLRFKRKKKKSRIPTFSKRTLAANGFTFADGTIPTSSSSSSDSSSSSSSCVCAPFSVEISTEGCCLYLGPEGVEAVGPGKITATPSGNPLPDCTVEVMLNGKVRNEIEVADGGKIEVGIKTSGGCECCETQRNCSTQSSPLWVQKSNEDRKTIVLDREAIREKVKLAVSRVRKRRKG